MGTARSEGPLRRRAALVLVAALTGLLTLPVVPSPAGAAPSPEYSVLDTIAVGNQPTGMAVDDATHDVYVSNTGDDTESEIDGSTDQVVGTVPVLTVPGGVNAVPGGVVADPLTDQVYISSVRAPIYDMDGSTLALNTGYSTTATPWGMTLNPSTHQFYAETQNLTMLVLDETSGALQTIIPLTPNPYENLLNSEGGIAVDPDIQRAYAEENGVLYVIDTATDAVVDTLVMPFGPIGAAVTVDPAVGKVFVAAGADIYVVSESTDTISDTIDAGFTFESMAVDSSTGTLYAADQGDNGAPSGQLVIIDDDTDTVTQDVALPGSPNSVVVDPGTHLAYVNMGLLPDIDVIGVSPAYGSGTVSFSSSTYVEQAGQTATVSVDRTGSLTQSATVHYATSDGTAVAGTDYTSVSGTLTFAAGASAASFTVRTTQHGPFDAEPSLTLTLSNASGGLRFPSTATLSILESVPPELTADAPPTAPVINQPYSYTYTATGTPAPTFSVSSGSLPTGLTLDATTGVLGGTPTVGGPFTFTVAASNGSYLTSGSPSTTVTVDVPPVLTDDTVPLNGAVGSPYTFAFAATGVPAPTFYVASGSFPAGVDVESDGTPGSQDIPAGPGTFTFQIGATNGVGPDAIGPETTVTITGDPIQPDAPTIGTATAGDGQASVAFTPPAYDGDSPITGYTVTAEPGGATADGISSPITVPGLTDGVPTTFTVTATNAIGTSFASGPSVAVTPDPLTAAPAVFTVDSPPASILGVSFGGTAQTDVYTFSASGNPAPTFSLAPGAPSWLSIDPTTGDLSGQTPWGGSIETYSVVATNTGGSETAGPFTLGVAGDPSWVAKSPPLTFVAGSPYTYTFVADGDPPTYGLEPGAPAWLSIDPDSGVLSGTPPAGTTTFTFTADVESDGSTLPTLAFTVDEAASTAPTVTSVTPASGTTAGGTAVTVHGAYLTGATAVDFGMAAATVTSCTATTCDVTTPAGTAGAVAVSVTTPDGTSTSTLSAADTYTYVAPPPPEPYHAVTPARICDTRSGQTKAACAGATTLGPDGTVTVTAAGAGGVPDTGATAVVVNVTVADTTARSHLTVFPGGESEPTASNLNWVAGQTVPNLVTVALSAAGTFEAENYAGSADVIVDIEGYYAAGAAGTGLYDALAVPARICDTRPGNPSGLSGTVLTQCQGRAPSPGGSLTVGVDGLGGVPSTGVGAVVLDVTALGAGATGHLTVYPAGSTAPLASDVNFTAGIVVPNRVIVPVGMGGVVDILSSGGDPQILVDVAGWFTDGSNSSAAGTEFTPASSPTRVCDTRTGTGTPCTGHTPGAHSTLAVTVAGIDGIPSAGITAVVLNLTATDTTATSHLTVSPAGEGVPIVSDLNWTAGRTVPNLVVATVGTGGQVDVTNYAGSADVIVDVVGWYSGGT